jgi:hypothetical protein
LRSLDDSTEEFIMALRVRKLPIIGLMLVCAGAAYAVAQNLPAGQIPAGIGDLNTVSQVQVRGQDGQVVLAGQFGEATTEDGETERTARLTATAGANASGQAEIEVVTRGTRVERELELEVDGLAANTSYSFLIDQQQAATFTTDAKGGAEVELKDVR